MVGWDLANLQDQWRVLDGHKVVGRPGIAATRALNQLLDWHLIEPSPGQSGTVTVRLTIDGQRSAHAARNLGYSERYRQ